MTAPLVVCITGASSGIGLATARAFATKGCKLALGARRIDRLEEISKELRELGAQSVIISALDVRSEISVSDWCEFVYSHYSHVDVLVNNAGLVLGTDTIETGRLKDWETVIDTNVLGVLRVCRNFIPRMKNSHKPSHLIMIGSISGHQVYEGGGPYCASKFGVNALTKTLKLELNGSPIRVGTIDPGMVETEFSLVRFQGDKERAKSVYRGFQALTAADVAECVVFMATRPEHVNIDEIILTPKAQATVYKTHRLSE